MMGAFSKRRALPTVPLAASVGVRHVHLLDTSVSSDNTGDEIIVESAKAALMPKLENDLITTSSSHDGLGPWSRPSVEAAQIAVLLGTNALSAKRQIRSSRYIWTVTKKDISALEGKVVLLGCGANRYFDRVEPEQVSLLGRLLSRDHIHSVRDDLGARIVEASGHRAINTTCPTLWRFAFSGADLPRTKPDCVCFTLTAHKADPSDALLVETLRSNYERVYFWPQQLRDLVYLDTLSCGRKGIQVLAPNLAAYDRLLLAERPDVVGTRLHGSIRGLHHACRAIAVAIDNRAAQIGEETGMPTVSRESIGVSLAERLNSDFAKIPKAPEARIREFLAQFD